ncbi:hypothetical protein HI914_02264 [Erysiphe necator]|nr:hypothetical protein HI914_02264 [Erysiphe necator]
MERDKEVSIFEVWGRGNAYAGLNQFIISRSGNKEVRITHSACYSEKIMPHKDGIKKFMASRNA